MEKEKLKFAFYWAASCGGCEIAVLDINEKILDVVALADIVFWPVAMDIKYNDVEAFPDKYIDVCFFNGAIRTEEQEYMAKMLRKKAKTLIAFGSCAHQGGIPGLANIANKKEVFERAYFQTPSTKNSKKSVTPKTSVHVKEGELNLPEFYDTVKTLDQIVEVDYYVPGCPPPVDLILKAIDAIAKNELPPKGSVLAPEKSVCDECPRKREEKRISRIYRVYEVTPDPEKCLLEQGILCMGPATRGGCGAKCIKANMPCTGCGGPCPNVIEQGAAMISALSSILGINEEKEETYNPERLISQIKDPLGTFYRYSLPASVLRRRIMKE
jgi:F420-non-reducing hydrogenase small subunit